MSGSMRAARAARFVLMALAFVAGITLESGVALGANQNETRIDATLTPSLFAPTAAIGDVSYEVRRYRSDFQVEVADLGVGVYDVRIGGAVVGQISVQTLVGGTEGRLAFSTRPTQTWEHPMTFDPRGKAIQISIGSTVFLSGTLSTTPNPEGPDDNPTFNDVVETITAIADGEGVRPRGTLHLVSGGKHASLTFELQRMPGNPQTITANGVIIAYFTPLANGIARVRLSTDPGPNDLPLDFDPADTTFHVVYNGQVLLEFKTGGAPIGGGTTPIGVTDQAFNNTGAAAGATGTATLRDHATRYDFDIELEDLPVGSYDLIVAGIKRATIAVTSTGDGTAGSISFSTLQGGNPPKSPLTFDPHGQTIQIVQGATVFLSMTFPS